MSVPEPPLVPASRSLGAVLRAQLAGGESLRLIVATGGAPVPLPEGNAYCQVVIQGVTVKVPKLKGVDVPAPGGTAYLIASRDFLLCLGTVSATSTELEEVADA